jgi:hypothetical protein
MGSKQETTACEEATGYLTDDLESAPAQGGEMAAQPLQLRLTKGPLCDTCSHPRST